MTPDERQMISGLFDRIRTQAGAQRDRDAEDLIAENVRAQPYAPYLMAQTVLVQEQALKAAAEKIRGLEAQLQNAGGAQPQSGGFLSNIGRSIFGGNEPAPPPRGGPQPGYVPQQNYAPPPPPNYPPQAGPGPWSQQQPQGGGMFGGGGFMRNALGMAAGVAGGSLLADGIRDIFGGHGGGMFGGTPNVVENVENVYVDQTPDGGTGGDYPADDPGFGDFGSDMGSNDDYNV